MSATRGRPKSENPKGRILGIRLPEDERALIEKAAKQKQKTASQWAREILVDRAKGSKAKGGEK